VASGCSGVSFAKLPVHGSRYADEPLALFDFVFGICAGSCPVPHCFPGTLVSRLCSSTCREATRNFDNSSKQCGILLILAIPRFCAE
jgi:hypothetical protein